MRVAIHARENSFAGHWVKYCKELGIEYKLVNCYDNGIIDNLRDCDVLLWHHYHASYKDNQLAKALLFSLEQAGMKVFPDFKTGWHYDNKLGQKYLLESVNAPLVKSYVFYDKKEALKWCRKTSYPKVFKLKGGAGSSNVRLVRTENEAAKIITRCFNRGFPLFQKSLYIREKFSSLYRRRAGLLSVIKSIVSLIFRSKHISLMPVEKGYSYFQDFIPDNNHDTRVIVIGKKAFAVNRIVREKDFRASGSGSIVYEKAMIDERCLEIAFQTSKKLGAQCLAYDFIIDKANNPLIVEISYAFSIDAYSACPGYWDDRLVWYQGKFNPCDWMIECVLSNEQS